MSFLSRPDVTRFCLAAVATIPLAVLGLFWLLPDALVVQTPATPHIQRIAARDTTRGTSSSCTPRAATCCAQRRSAPRRASNIRNGGEMSVCDRAGPQLLVGTRFFAPEGRP